MQFPETQWTLLAQATLNGDASGRMAMEEFCRRYREPVVQFIRGRGYSAEDADDLAHDFLVRVMEQRALRRADAAQGRFRSFLLGALVHKLADARDRSRARKRGGGEAPLSLDIDDGVSDLAAIPAPDVERFDRQWALRLLELTLRALEAEFVQRGRGEAFEVLRNYVPGGVRPPPYETAAHELGISLGAFKTEVHRMRRRFRELLRIEIAVTVSRPEQVDEELAYLGHVLQSAAT